MKNGPNGPHSDCTCNFSGRIFFPFMCKSLFYFLVFLEILRRFQKVSWYFVNSRKGRGLNVDFPTINSLIPFPSSLTFGDRFQQPLQIDLSSVRYEGKKPRFLSSDFLRFSPVSSQFLLSLSLFKSTIQYVWWTDDWLYFNELMITFNFAATEIFWLDPGN